MSGIGFHAILGKGGCFRLYAVDQLPHIEFALFQQFDKKGRCTGLEPEIVEFKAVQRIQQTERIEHARSIFPEMIAVVLMCQFAGRFLTGISVFPGYRLDLRLEVLFEFF